LHLLEDIFAKIQHRFGISSGLFTAGKVFEVFVVFSALMFNFRPPESVPFPMRGLIIRRPSIRRTQGKHITRRN
jgi:hypothetical protein